MFDPAATIVVAFEYGAGVRDSTHQWITKTFPAENIRSVRLSPLIVARNRAIRDMVLPVADKFSTALFIDNDVTITHPGLENWLALEGDVVSCECAMRHPNAWAPLDAFHNPLWRCSMQVLQAIQPPWFHWIYADDGCGIVGCDCRYFALKVIAAGFSVCHGGHCGHTMNGSWHQGS